jgi:hypothetical protein
MRLRAATCWSQNDNLSFAQGDGRCIEWMQVPGKGVVCTRHCLLPPCSDRETNIAFDRDA